MQEKITIEDGIIKHKKVTKKIYKNLERGKLSQVNAVVLHRTAASTASSTFNTYAGGQVTGAHFLIDKTGMIYQTASLLEMCWHVGLLKVRCMVENTCASNELKNINALFYENGILPSHKKKDLSRYEVKKSYPIRYPSNQDSIGIEVVGQYLKASRQFEKPTTAQDDALRWLVTLICNDYTLNARKDVYAYWAMARKKENEGKQLLQAMLSGGVL